MLIEDPLRFEQELGMSAASGLREFFASDHVSPDWLSALRRSTGTDPFRHGFFLVQREHRLIIGTAGFKGPPGTEGTVEIAYGIVPAFEGQGYATEAAGALVGFALADEQVRTVRAHTLPEANASSSVLRKCGFLYVGEVVEPDDGPVWRWERGR